MALQRTSKNILNINYVDPYREFKFEFFKYMNNLPAQFASLPAKNPFSSNVGTLEAVEDALRVRAAYAIYTSVVQGIAKDKATVKPRTLYNEMYQQDQVTISTYHLVYYTVWSARNHLAKANIKCPNLLKHLRSLVTLYGLNELAKDSLPLYDCGYFKQGAGIQITESIKALYSELRPQYISLVESFDIPDSVLNSAIGNSYGDIYE